MAFSQPIQIIKTGLYTKFDSPEGGSLAELAGKRVAAVAGTYQAQYLEENHPEIELHTVSDRADYLIALMRGDVAAFVEEVPTTEAGLAKFGLGGSVSRRMELFSNEVHAGVLKENTALFELVESGLGRRSITLGSSFCRSPWVALRPRTLFVSRRSPFVQIQRKR